ncbi:MAG: type II toxin-antitoxin system RelE/ParE family toxin [Opitutaceae bacterium]
MVYQVVWTEPAIANLKKLCEHIAKDNVDAARKLGIKLVEYAESLDQLPLRGKVYSKFGDGQIHEIPYRGYRIFYKIYEDLKRVDILLVWHGARDEPSFIQ